MHYHERRRHIEDVTVINSDLHFIRFENSVIIYFSIIDGNRDNSLPCRLINH